MPLRSRLTLSPLHLQESAISHRAGSWRTIAIARVKLLGDRAFSLFCPIYQPQSQRSKS
ncbi:MAG: hypothetical protein JGK17_21320 [Microcoleus sp. PH2017_10_PVI_O_A]|uniref:hypothetical protein n=1 Tax=unclassified Microcoleus TaxID=2642155 RepID=UPI001E1018EF|nr:MULTISPECIES: hypothetical protein [unclassified Microcoleus]MCC3408078.1 hypothetical protein [Microcoleus sp. PH2017_10_PVI_O_A]MCC3462198.1 hypothetical protein [Microcoleus sp. PH2017_11_PCY_U_A]MCC3480629.1 hypothetical protein [Microcoleus sp. PH2017_12_PCY_D_A]MCC3531327.1 hypothetical protein [Microcoleus sp. PH2017_21_RUC_O_A]MCC3543634.1 hypothetical protein [Microcoleus sp. PH2017_22_RUC_O_B]